MIGLLPRLDSERKVTLKWNIKTTAGCSYLLLQVFLLIVDINPFVTFKYKKVFINILLYPKHYPFIYLSIQIIQEIGRKKKRKDGQNIFINSLVLLGGIFKI